MGFFVKAAAEALKRFPAVNASIDGNDIVYHGFYDIGVAVSTERGLVVPVLRDCDRMSIAEVEGGIRDSVAAKDGKLAIEDDWWHLYYHERWCIWFITVYADSKPTTNRDTWHA